MTEITYTIEKMPVALQQFILQWGDMGGQWGVNRSVAQIHALLYIEEKPLNAEEISYVLGIARSNVSNSLKELQGWGIIRRVPISGDRRDFYTAEIDVWEIARRIASIRKQREIDPALRTLRNCIAESERDEEISEVQRQRLEAMYEFTEDMDRWYSQMLKFPSAKLSALLKMGDRIISLLHPGRGSDLSTTDDESDVRSKGN